ncbi:MAG: indole-3-glycerol phosphate synthase TrpC [Candidatus Acidiferrales bacterium]
MQPGTQSGSVLDRILEVRRAAIEHRKRVLPEAVLKMSVKKAAPVRDLESALTRGGVNVIGELKKASPSRGVLREDFNVENLARAFEHAGAAALSVLTEEEFFQGSLKNMRDARKKVEIPVLRKDFIIDPWQVWETRATDGDSFLLIVAALPDAALGELLLLGRELGMEPLVEVHSRAELDCALAAGAKILGVNNRDLRTLEMRLETSFELIEAIPAECTAVCESGIRDASQISALRKVGFDAFLVGEHLMTQPNPADELLKLLAAA